MDENSLSKLIIGVAIEIHKTLGPGLLESVYEEIMSHELEVIKGLKVERQKIIPVIWKNVKIGTAFRADLIVEEKIVVEIKSTEGLNPVHSKQVLTYLKLTNLKLGILLNFNSELLRNGIQRIVNNL